MHIVFFGTAQVSRRGETSKKPSRPKNTAWDGEENEIREGVAFLSLLQETICRKALRAICPRTRYVARGATRYAASGVRGTKTRRANVPSLPLEGKMLSAARQMRWKKAYR